MAPANEGGSRCSLVTKDNEIVTARPYQIQLFEQAMKSNKIIYLGTGTGKTFIAVLLIKEMASEISERSWEAGAKRTVFLANTVPLVKQQANYIGKMIPFQVAHYVGEMGVDFWSKGEWIKQFKENQVLVMSAQIFLDILERNYISIDRVNLLIMDECHHAAVKSKHPMHEVMRQIYERRKDTPGPRILGLTASVINKKVKPCSLDTFMRGLERTMMSEIATAENLQEACKYGTKAEQTVMCYKDPDVELPSSRRLEKLLSDFKETYKEMYDEFKQILQWIECVYVTMGAWCGLRGVEILLQEEEDFNDAPQMIDLLKSVEIVLSNEMDGCSEKERLRRFKTNKLEVLMNILRCYTKEKLYGLIFVEQRFVCKVLCAYMKAVFQYEDPNNPKEVEWIVGGSGHTFLKATEEGVKHQGANSTSETGILSRFRRHELNLIVATSILEEGLDVPKCSLVLRYDLSKEFRSYVQSRGRARAENAKYIMMVSESEQAKLLQDLIVYNKIESMLKAYCKQRLPVEQSEVVEIFDDLIIPHYEPFGVDGPKITGCSALSTLYKYCGKLPHDRFTNPVPIWRCYEDGEISHKSWEEDTDDYFEGFVPDDIGDDREIGYMYEMMFPISCPVKALVKGPTMASKYVAKSACALLACELLHRYNELDDDHLQPIVHDVTSDDDDTDDEAETKIKTGTKKARRFQKKAIPVELQCMSRPVGSKAILYRITLKMVKPLDDELNPRGFKIFHPEESERCLAIVTTKPIPQLEPFRLYTRWGEVSVMLTEVPVDFILDQPRYVLYAKFHYWLFETALSFGKEKALLEVALPTIYFIVPLKKDERSFSIDTAFIKEVLKYATFDYHQPMTKKEAESFVFDERKYEDAVLCTTYNPSCSNVQRYSTEEVCHDVTPTSNFPNKQYTTFESYGSVATYEDYYRLKYGVTILHRQQRLVKCEVFNHRLNVLTPRVGDEEAFQKGESKKHTMAPSISRDSPNIVPELCRIHVLPASLYRQVLWLPSILKRISCLLTSNALRRKIAVETGVGTLDPPRPEFPKRKLMFYEDVDLSTHPGPSASLILQAFTPSKTNEAFDLERLEMIGDSFLKLCVSVSCFMKDDVNHEGMLTKRKSKLISNKNLFRLSESKGLSELVNGPMLIPHKNWTPPGYRVNENVEKALMDAGTPENHWNVAPIMDGLKEMSKEEIQLFIKKEHKRLKALEEEKEKQSEERLTVGLREWRVLSDKSIADSIEALIGAYLLTCGPEAAKRVMCWLGLPVQAGEPPEYAPFSAPKHAYCENVDFDHLLPRINKLSIALDRLEHTIGYKFKEVSFLVQAMTHGSYSRNKVTNSYERLEFLGDAVLDYLITWHIYHLDKKMSPGDLTDLRSALVNNVAFGALAIKWNLHQHLKHMAPMLPQAINRFCVLQEDNDYEVDEVWCYVQENESEILEEVEVPKVLGDIFESLAGAIYLDSNMDLKEVWRVFQPILQPLIDKFQRNIPLNPIRQVFELCSSVKFSQAIGVKGKRIQVTVTLGDKRYTGIGTNKKIGENSSLSSGSSSVEGKKKKLKYRLHQRLVLQWITCNVTF